MGSALMQVDPRFRSVADRFFRMFQSPRQGSGALVAYLHGERSSTSGRGIVGAAAPSAFARYP